MAKTIPTIEETTFDLTIEEFCQRKSVGDHRVELLGAFYADEVRAERVKDSEQNYESRYAAFAKNPA